MIIKRGRPAFFKAFIAAVVFLYLPIQSMAWGMIGHRIVGEIAAGYLTPKARIEIEKVLGDESMAMASNWADFIKSDTSYKYLNNWHWVDFAKNLSYSEMQAALAADQRADAYTKLNFLVKELKNKNLEKDKKLMYLRLLIHIAGDVHQPFHVSEEGDNGGNALKVSWFNEPSNIHKVWDEQLIDYQQLSYTEYTKAINHTSLKQRTEWQKQPLSVWLYDSYKICRKLREDLQQPDLKLSYVYNFKNIQIVNQQLLKAGVHLAGLLNQIYG